jgi:hypothetical protein
MRNTLFIPIFFISKSLSKYYKFTALRKASVNSVTQQGDRCHALRIYPVGSAAFDAFSTEFSHELKHAGSILWQCTLRRGNPKVGAPKGDPLNRARSYTSVDKFVRPWWMSPLASSRGATRDRWSNESLFNRWFFGGFFAFRSARTSSNRYRNDKNLLIFIFKKK